MGTLVDDEGMQALRPSAKHPSPSPARRGSSCVSLRPGLLSWQLLQEASCRPSAHLSTLSHFNHIWVTPALVFMCLVFKLNNKMTSFGQTLFYFGEKEEKQDKSLCAQMLVFWWGDPQ